MTAMAMGLEMRRGRYRECDIVRYRCLRIHWRRRPCHTTNPLSVDSDGDGIEDGDEDANQNGRVDPGETPANSDLNVIACDATREYRLS